MHTVRVLIADPEAEFTAVLADRLESWGFAAMAANSREEALELLVTFRPEVAVIGLRGDGGRGIELMAAMQAVDPAIRMILLLCKGTALAGMRGMTLGAADCIPLPLELGQLIDSIRRAIGSSESIATDETDPE